MYVYIYVYSCACVCIYVNWIWNNLNNRDHYISLSLSLLFFCFFVFHFFANQGDFITQEVELIYDPDNPDNSDNPHLHHRPHTSNTNKISKNSKNRTFTNYSPRGGTGVSTGRNSKHRSQGRDRRKSRNHPQSARLRRNNRKKVTNTYQNGRNAYSR